MTPEELRLECLKLVQHSANATGLLLEPGQIIARARTYADFVMNWREQDVAESVNGEQNPEMPPEGFRKPRPGAAVSRSHASGGAA